MRDIALSIVIFGLLPVILMRPHVGALMWAWISIMNPHRLAYGFAYTFPFAAIIAGTTLLATVLSKERKPFPWGPIPVLIIIMVAWMSFTSLFAMAPAGEVYDAWIRVVKIHLMLLLTLMLIRSRSHIDQLVWVIVISLGYYGVKGGVWTVLTGGGDRVWGPPGGVIEGNNELALALVVVIPLMYYLMSTTPRRLVKYALIGMMVACGFSIVGSHSRGAFLAIVACAAMLALKSRRPLGIGVLVAAALLTMFAFMPEKWITRMETIAEYDVESSASNRIYTWHTLWNVALDRPFVGAGFVTAQEEVFQKYAPQFATVHASHSIYFQALGEHGFVGLALFLALLVVTWIKAGRVSRRCRQMPGYEWGDLLMRMVQVALVGFAVGGAFLSLLHFDLPYYLMALVVILEASMNEESKAAPGHTTATTPYFADRNPAQDMARRSPAVRE